MAADISTTSDDAKNYGFEREEMYSSKLENTVGPYARHVLLCYKSHLEWAPRVEASDDDTFPKLFAGAVKARQNDFASKTNLTVCGGGDVNGFADGDVMVFPDFMVYRGLKESDVDAFVDDVLVNGKPWTAGMQESLPGSYVFVCSHASRDKRCGVCGPVLIENFNNEIELRGLKDQIFVSACSHVGGHKYAGNLIVFSRDPNAENKTPMGHWYGYVTPNDVPSLIDDHILRGQVIKRIWRGAMGEQSVTKDEKAVDQKLPNGEDLSKSEKHQETQENVSGCCQGVNGVSCCRSESVEPKAGNKVQEKKGCLGSLSSWVGKWEQNDIYFAAGVVGAVATVAVAYSFYRRSG